MCMEIKSEANTAELLTLRKEVRRNGNIYYYNRENQLHRELGPAIEYINGRTEWYRRGELHRKDGPAVILPSGYEEWWENGQTHRLGGPAVTYSSGDKEWWENGRYIKREPG